MTNRPARRALQGSANEAQLRKVLADLRGVQSTLAAVEAAAPTAPAAGGPVDVLGRQMESAARDLSHLPRQINERIGALRDEVFVGHDRSGVATVSLTAACTRASIRVDARAAADLGPEEVAGCVEEAHAAAAARFEQAHEGAQAWVDGALDPIRSVVHTANAGADGGR